MGMGMGIFVLQAEELRAVGITGGGDEAFGFDTAFALAGVKAD